MLRIEGHVEYADGRRQQFTAGPMVLAEWELYAHKHGLPVDHDATPMLHMAFIAWKACGGPVSFEEWRASVLDLDLTSAEALPTVAAPAA